MPQLGFLYLLVIFFDEEKYEVKDSVVFTAGSNQEAIEYAEKTYPEKYDLHIHEGWIKVKSWRK